MNQKDKSPALKEVNLIADKRRKNVDEQKNCITKKGKMENDMPITDAKTTKTTDKKPTPNMAFTFSLGLKKTSNLTPATNNYEFSSAIKGYKPQ